MYKQFKINIMKKTTFLLCAILFIFNSCEKENIAEKGINQEISSRTVKPSIAFKQGQGKIAGGIIEIVIEAGHGRIPGAYLNHNYEESINFQIDFQDPCDVLEVDAHTGRLSLLNGGVESDGNGLCGNGDESKLRVHYTVTSADGEMESFFFTLSYEDFIILDLEED